MKKIIFSCAILLFLGTSESHAGTKFTCTGNGLNRTHIWGEAPSSWSSGTFAMQVSLDLDLDAQSGEISGILDRDHSKGRDSRKYQYSISGTDVTDSSDVKNNECYKVRKDDNRKKFLLGVNAGIGAISSPYKIAIPVNLDSSRDSSRGLNFKTIMTVSGLNADEEYEMECEPL